MDSNTKILVYFLVEYILKIVIKNNDPIRLYHHPREVSVHPKSKTVKTFNADGSLLETFKLVNKETLWNEDFENDQSEIIVTLHVEPNS